MTGAPPDPDGTGDTGGAPPTIRRATNGDLPRLHALQAAAFPDPNRTLLRTGVRAGLALVAADRSAAGGTDGPSDLRPEPVGYALFTADGETVYVAELAVAPGHRRRGHGRRLLAAVAARNPDHAALRLTTRADNERARAFYESVGFREARRLPDHYDGTETGGGPTDGVLLVRDLE